MTDNNTLDLRNRDAALKTVERFIDNRFAGNYEWAVMSVGPKVKTIQPFTDQRTLLDSALLEVRRSPAYEAQREIDRGILSDTSRQALETEFPDRIDLGGIEGRSLLRRSEKEEVNDVALTKVRFVT